MKKSGKAAMPWKSVAMGLLLCVAVYGGALTGITWLLMKGILPAEQCGRIVAAGAFLATLLGANHARRGKLGGRGGVLVIALFLMILLLGGLALEETPTWIGRGGVIALCIVAGGVTGCLIRKKGRGKRLWKNS